MNKAVEEATIPTGSGTLKIRADRINEEELLAAFPSAGIYHSPRWARVVLDAYGLSVLSLTAVRDGTTVGFLQLVLQKSLFWGKRLTSLPWFDASGILAVDDDVRKALLESASQLRNENRAKHVEIRQNEELPLDLPQREDKVTMLMDLPPDSQTLLKDFRYKTRNRVRKSLKQKMEFASGTDELLDEFYAIYFHTMRQLNSPPHSKRFFRCIIEHFPDESRLYVVRIAGRAVAAGFTLRDRRGAHVPWSGSDRRGDKKRLGNVRLYWGMLADACEDGMRSFDFGRSTRESGTWQFKKQWGAHEVPLHWYFILPDGQQLPELKPDAGMYRTLSKLWGRMPACMIRRLGPRIISRLA